METTVALQQKIFLVDDDYLTSAMYQQALQNLNYSDITVFSNGQDCLNALIEEPSIIFLDYHMDHMSGLEVLRKIRRFDPNIYVVFISAQEDIQTAVTSLKYGSFDYIVKGEGDIEKIGAVMEKIQKVQDLLKYNNRGIVKKFLALFI